MNPFEEKFTAWVDAKLSGGELEAFEKELNAHPEAGKDKEEVLKIRALLRQRPTASRLTNPDFFNHQLLQRIAAETPLRPAAGLRRTFFRPLPRFVLAGGLSLGVAFALYEGLVPKSPDDDIKSDYFVRVVDTWPADPSISASTVYDPDNNLTVVWLDGLNSVPESYAQK
jgi:hypothetical protein